MRRVPREGAAPAEQPERRASARAGMPQRSSPPAVPGACGAVHSCNCTRRKKRKGMRRERRSAKQPSDVRACVGLRERLADSPIAARLDLVPATLPLRRLIDCLRVSVGKLEATRSDAFLGWFLTFLRHVNGLPHTSQSFVGRFSFLTPRGMARDPRRVCDPPTPRAPINTARTATRAALFLLTRYPPIAKLLYL